MNVTGNTKYIYSDQRKVLRPKVDIGMKTSLDLYEHL